MWSEKLTLRFIDLYKERGLLWDPKHPHYYNKVLKNDAWEELATELGTSAEECRKKIFGLQSSLRREKWKIRKSQATGKGSDEMYVSSWFAFKSLSFLLDKDKSRKATNEAKRQKEHLEEDVSINNDFRLCSLPTQKHLVKKRKTDDADNRLSKNYVYSAPTTSKTDEEDICQLFGNLVAKRMQVYSPLVQSAVQQAVMNVLFNADRGYYDQKSSSSAFDPSLSQHSQCLQNNSQNYNVPSHFCSTSTRRSPPSPHLDHSQSSKSSTHSPEPRPGSVSPSMTETKYVLE